MGAAFATFTSYFVIVAFRVIDTKKYIKLELFKLNNFLSIMLLIIGVLINSFSVGYICSLSIVIPIIILFLNRHIIVIFYEYITKKK